MAFVPEPVGAPCAATSFGRASPALICTWKRGIEWAVRVRRATADRHEIGELQGQVLAGPAVSGM